MLNNCFIAVPSAFTPNADGRNDFLYPTNALKADNLEFKVFNRWGQLVYNGNGYWDGMFNGAMQPADTYFYYITIQGPDQNNPNVNVQYNLTGSFTLLH